MIEVIPIMLFILGWHPDRPGEIDLQRPEIIFTSVEECETAGQKMAAQMTAAAADKSGARYEARCMAIPASSEFEEAYKPMSERAQ